MENKYSMDYENFSLEFINNVEKNSLNLNYIKENNYHYCGGNTKTNNDLKYFKSYFKNKQIPPIPQTNKCICGKEIEGTKYWQ